MRRRVRNTNFSFNPGDTFWYEFEPGFLVQVTAQVVEDIYEFPPELVAKYNIKRYGDGGASCLWHYRDDQGTSRFTSTVDGDYVDDWPPVAVLDLTPEELAQCQKVNQLFWLDEPVGHDVQLGRGLWATKEEALAQMKARPRRCNQRLKNKKLAKWRKKSKEFIAWTHRRNGGPNPAFPVYKRKRVFSRGG